MPARPQIPLLPGGILEAWQRKDMVIAALHEEGCAQCSSLRTRLHETTEAFAREQATVVFVAADGPFALGVQRPPGQALLAVADKYARLYATWDAHAQSADELVRAAGEWLAFIQSQCEECGAPVDWA